jgi:membrane-associated phospholipid phosphatase
MAWSTGQWTSVRREVTSLGRPPVAVVVTSLTGLAGTVVVTGAVLLRLTTAWDAETLRWFTTLDQPGPAHNVVRTLVTAGAFWLVGVVIGVVALLLAWRRRRPMIAVVCAVTLVVMDAFIAVIKVITGRTAPHTGVDQILVGGSSYPSGHTAHATVGLTLLAVLLLPRAVDGGRQPVPGRGRWAAVVVGSTVVGLTTVILGYHWFTEVIAGWFMAVTVLAPAVWVLTHVPAEAQGVSGRIEPTA